MSDILIVDVNAVHQKLLAFLLARANYTYEISENGQIEMEKLRKGAFRLVLLDMMMPVMNGFETVKAIRAETQFATLPVIAITANALKGENEKCRKAGCDDYIAKPYAKEQILSAIERLLTRRSKDKG